MEQETPESLYGSNVVVGRAEESTSDNPLEGRDVKITTSNTSTVKVGEEPEGTSEDNKESEENPEGSPEGNASEAQTQAEVDQARQAEQDTKKVLDSKGVQWDALETEYTKDGKLSEATYTKLAEAGFPKTVVDAYIAGVEATASKFVNSVVGYAGGEKAFQQMTQFITGLGETEAKAFNSLIDNGNLAVIKTAIEGYKARMVAKFGTNNPTILGSEEVPNQVPQGYPSKGEMVKAMSDKRYGRDPAYTKEVEAKVAKSKFIQIRR